MTGRVQKLAKAMAHAPDFWRVARRQGPPLDDDGHLRIAAQWLLAAQRAGGGGYAHSYHLLHGWQPAYPETTGYIIPSLYRLHLRWGGADLLASVEAAARWLAAIQNADGSFADLGGARQVFDTGQILIGFNDLARNRPGLIANEAHRRAAGWLASVQEADGSFIRHAYNNRPHSYYSRVGAALITAGALLVDGALTAAGVRNIEWTLAQQQPNGFFRHASFDDAPAYLHTMIYIIEGLLDAYDVLADGRCIAAVLGFATPLLQAAGPASVLRSQYGEDYSVANRETCMTGLAQWAGVCVRLSRITHEPAWRVQADATLAYLKARQIRSRSERLNGGLMGSTPLTGRYMTAAIPNWGVKFFIDAVLERASLATAPPAARS